MIFISHDLTVINKIADRVVVMKNGQLIEMVHVNQSCISRTCLYELFIINEEED